MRMFTSLLALGAVGCGSTMKDETVPGDGAPPDEEWLVLHSATWQLQPGEEAYRCVVQTLDRDIVIGAIRALAPLGTHHTVLTLYEGELADGVHACDGRTVGRVMLHGSAVGSQQVVLPEGVGIRLRAGARVISNLHLYNLGDAILEGESGIEYLALPPEALVHEAEYTQAGPLAFTLENTGATPIRQTVTGNCSIAKLTPDAPIQVFSILGHMHQRGRHIRAVLVRDGGETAILDTDFNFFEQRFYPQEPVLELRPTDVVRTECTFEVAPGDKAGWGDSTNDEMCFTELFYYPARGALLVCPS